MEKNQIILEVDGKYYLLKVEDYAEAVLCDGAGNPRIFKQMGLSEVIRMRRDPYGCWRYVDIRSAPVEFPHLIEAFNQGVRALTEARV